MNGNISKATKMFGMAIFACVISFFVYISFFILMRTIATDVTGYTIYQVNDDGTTTDIEVVEKAPESIKSNQGYKENRSEMPTSATITLGILQVICGVGIFMCTTGSILANTAAKDRNNTDFNEATFDKFKGLKIGALSVIPLFIYNLIIIALRFLSPSSISDWAFWIYRWIVLCPVKPIVDLITGNANKLHNTPIWSVFALIVFGILVMVFSFILYLICYNEDSFLSKFLYKSARKKDKTKRLGGR